MCNYAMSTMHRGSIHYLQSADEIIIIIEILIILMPGFGRGRIAFLEAMVTEIKAETNV